jgi:hypothetical protein
MLDCVQFTAKSAESAKFLEGMGIIETIHKVFGPFRRKGFDMNAEVDKHADKIKHLEFIQGIITRMNNNSFQMKGWMVALVSTLLAIYVSTQNQAFVLVAIFPALLLWFLDAYYLQQERKFRGLYDDVAGITKHHEIAPFAMRPNLYTGDRYSLWDVLGSKTILPVYLPVIALLVVIYFFL